jgi:hypothetical protein
MRHMVAKGDEDVGVEDIIIIIIMMMLGGLMVRLLFLGTGSR